MLVFLIIIAVLLVLLLIPVRLKLSAGMNPSPIENDSSFSLYAYYLFLRFRIVDSEIPPKIKKPKKHEKPEEPKESTIKKRIKEKGLLEFLHEIFGILSLIPAALKKILRHVKIPMLRLNLSIVDEDAADTAVTSGVYMAVIYPIIGFLSSLMKIKHRDVTVLPDYTRYGESAVTASALIKARVSPIFLIAAALWFFGKFLMKSMKNTKNMKDISGTGEKTPA